MNQISTLGTLHDVRLSNPNYGIKDLMSAIEQFQPNVIISEVRPQFPSVEDATLDGGIEQALVYAYAEVQNIKVLPVDWFDDELIKEMIREEQSVSEDVMGSLEKLSQFREDFYSTSLVNLNSEK